MRRTSGLATVLALAVTASFADDSRSSADSVTTSNGVVVHGVDVKLLAARLRDADRKAVSGDARGAASDLAEILAGDAAPLVEDGDDAYLCGLEAALQRVAALPAEGLARYREIVDPRAAAVLAEGVTRGDPSILSRHALDMALSSDGPKILVTLADFAAARGQTGRAAQALTDLLRLWPDAGPTAQMPGVDRASVVVRLASLFASLGDEESARWIARDASPALLAAPSPVTAGAAVKDDLARCAAAAASRAPDARTGPTVPLRVAAELVFAPENAGDFDGPSARDPSSREIAERPLPIGAPDRPTLLTRAPLGPQGQDVVVALAQSPGADGSLYPLWSWPSPEELKAGTRRGGDGTFSPARCGDVVIFAWPTPPRSIGPGGDKFESDERSTLIAQSIRGEGRLIDERGAYEKDRDDGDPELAELSFCGRPLVVGDSVFTTLVRRTKNGGGTELHVARFDLVTIGPTQRLRERWRRHVLDGGAMPPVQFSADQDVDVSHPLATPTFMAERWGRIYVASNTGAAACLAAADGRPQWVAAYPRFGPPLRHTVATPSPNQQRTWKDVAPCIDGPYVWIAPRDADHLLEFRAMPRLARTTLVQTLKFHGGGGGSSEQGQLLPNLEPDEVLRVQGGVGWFSGKTTDLNVVGLAVVGRPLASLRMRAAAPTEARCAYAYAQIPETVPAGTPCVVRGAVLFPTYKSIYRVSMDDFEAAPQVLWQAPSVRRGAAAPDAVGSLVLDGGALWSITTHRVVLLEPTAPPK